MEAQEVINWLFAGVGALLGAILKTLWQAVKDLQKADTSLADKVGQIEVLVAGAYVRKDEFARVIEAVFAKLDKVSDKIDHINDKIDSKADK